MNVAPGFKINIRAKDRTRKVATGKKGTASDDNNIYMLSEG
jgi:hypothetical protein